MFVIYDHVFSSVRVARCRRKMYVQESEDLGAGLSRHPWDPRAPLLPTDKMGMMMTS